MFLKLIESDLLSQKINKHSLECRFLKLFLSSCTCSHLYDDLKKTFLNALIVYITFLQTNKNYFHSKFLLEKQYHLLSIGVLGTQQGRCERNLKFNISEQQGKSLLQFSFHISGSSYYLFYLQQCVMLKAECTYLELQWKALNKLKEHVIR